MSDRTLTVIGRVVALAAITMSIAGAALTAGLHQAFLLEQFVIGNALLGVGFGIVAWLALPTQARNGAVWSVVVAAFFGGAYALSIGTAIALVESSGLVVDLAVLSPADVPVLTRVVIMQTSWTWVLAFITLMTFGFLLFPDGHPPSPRWRWLGWASATTIAVLALLMAWPARPTASRIPYADQNEFEGTVTQFRLVEITFILALGLSAACAAALVVRFRRSSGADRQQFRWIAWGVSVFVAAIIMTTLFESVIDDRLDYPMLLAIGALIASYGIAITRYRLYDIDVVISRTLIFAVLAGFITLVYALIVVGIGSFVDASSIWLSIVATAVVAIAFEPVRARVQRWANRVVYGKRATPYEVLSDLTSQFADTEEEDGLLDRMAHRLAAGTGAAEAQVWLRNQSGFRLAASSASASRVDALWSDGLPEGAVVVEHDEEVLGGLVVDKPRGEALTPTETRLMEDLAGSAGLVMRKLTLDQALQAKASELGESRRRLLGAEDAERRRLERELHDGAQQLVVGLKVGLDVASRVAEDEQAARSGELIHQMSTEAQSAIDQIRNLARGIYPPLLLSDGLIEAIDALAARSPVPVVVTSDLDRRTEAEIEAAVYFCVSEALTNAAKHGRGPITVELSETDRSINFTVADAGPGFDATAQSRGAGLINLRDRVDTLGGRLTIESAPGTHTTISGVLPTSVRVASG